MSKLHLTLATGYYDHVTDLVTGRVGAQGIDLTCLQYPMPNEMFARFLLHGDYDVSELSMAKYCSLVSQGDERFIAIPVFPSRATRHSSLYVRRDGKVQSPAEIRNCVVGLPEWAQTAAVYTRGMLMREYGFELASVDWVQAGVDKPGRAEKVASRLPPGVRRLFEDWEAAERAYYTQTRLFPIMHTVAIRRETYEQNRWIAASLYAAFERAKALCYDRLVDQLPVCSIPWAQPAFLERLKFFGGDPFAYGLDANRRVLDTLTRYLFEQGLTRRRFAVDELFAPEAVDVYAPAAWGEQRASATFGR